MDDKLMQLVEDGLIDAVRARLMSGKEASVFVVERRGELIAAKVYKDRDQRTFKATADYTEGRNQTRNTRDKRAMHKRTTYGQKLAEESWRDMEYRALFEAWQAGVRVPEPILLYEDVLLMQLLVDEAGAPAPRLADFDLPAEVAALLHREIFGQVRLLLMSGRVHGDLSAFNILIARDGPTLIDMPQVVDASVNSQAREMLTRDLRNVTEHLARFDARLLRFRDCGEPLWEHYRRGTIESATEPEEAGLYGHGHKSRRVRDAERGRAGRERAPRAAHDPSSHAPDARDARGPRPQDPQGQPRGRGGPRPDQRQQHRSHDQGPRDPQQQRPHDSRPHDSRPHDSRPRDPQQQRPQEQRPRDPQRSHDQRPRDSQQPQRQHDSRPHDQRPRDPQPQRPHDARPNDQRRRDPQQRPQGPRPPRPGRPPPAVERVERGPGPSPRPGPPKPSP